MKSEILSNATAAIGPLPSLVRSVPLGFPPDALISDGDGTVLRVSAASHVPIASATFEPGREVRFQGNRRGIVVRDLGDVVEVTDERHTPPLGRHAKQTYVTPVPRGRLAAENLSTIIQTIGVVK